jgi:hypothetical protein
MIRPSDPVADTAVNRARVLATHPLEVSVALRDGSHVTVRPIRPEDAAPLRAGFERLSE